MHFQMVIIKKELFKGFILFWLGFERAAQVLIQKGADVNIIGQDGNTALIVAASKGWIGNVLNISMKNILWLKTTNFFTGFETIVKDLVGKGADVNHTNKYDASALILATLVGEM